jgi:ribosomal protein S18 acetylase RimI-like enzyme
LHSQNVEFRTAAESDLDDIVGLWMESSKYHEGIDPRLTLRSDVRKHLRAFYSRLISDEKNHLVVAFVDDSIVGYICAQIQERPPIHFEKESGFVDGFFVKPNHRRQGIGSTFYQMGLRWLMDHKIGSIRLSVAYNNTSSLVFWKNIGLSELMYLMHTQI